MLVIADLISIINVYLIRLFHLAIMRWIFDERKSSKFSVVVVDKISIV